MLDAADSAKPAENKAFATAVNGDAHKSAVLPSPQPPSTATDDKRETELVSAMAPPQPVSHTSFIVPSIAENICDRAGEYERPGWRADCKDLAQRLLFSEDLEETEHALKAPVNGQVVGQETNPDQKVDCSTK